MPSAEVQRTLVKSPPELWAELSDAASLARHLGELGQIQLTRVEPESAVEWEAENVKGSVQLKASGWGTKVTFSLTREPPDPIEQEADAPEPKQATREPASEPPEPELTKPEPIEPEPTDPEPTEPESNPEPEPAWRRGFFARLFRRRRTEPVAAAEAPTLPEALIEPSQELPAEASQEPRADTTQEPASQEPRADTTQEPQVGAIVEPADLAAELAAMEQAMVEQDTALLTAVLDRLGSAHHRPFSRG